MKLLAAAGRMAADIRRGVPPSSGGGVGSADGRSGGGRWLTLAGQSGCGKSHLANALLSWARKYFGVYQAAVSGNRLIEVAADYEGATIWQRRALAWIEAPEMASEWKRGNYALGEELAKSWLLVIDDLGSDRDTSGFLSEQWFKLLNRRMGKWTIITTNLLGDDISSRLEERIASRMIRDGNILIESKATDFFA